mgnify:CR=1 FL=1
MRKFNGWPATDRKTAPTLRFRQLLLFWALAAILALYLVMALAYAVLTPLWESPDEPAHYNYIRYLIEHRQFPVLQAQDYDFNYLERIKAARFPAEMSIDPIRYEFHQPPLYYVIGAIFAAPWPASAQPMVLRFLSVMIGVLCLYVVFRVVAEIFPQQPIWSLGATAFAASVPMHVAMTAAVNNDALAELILALVLLTLIRRVCVRYYVTWRSDLLLGLLLGLGLITKTTTYVAIPLTVIVVLAPAVVHCGRPETDSLSPGLLWRSLLASLARALGVALLTGLPWFVRNSLVYGGLDILGLVRHNAIMVEQPRTADWLARLGSAGLAKEFIFTTFRSFWAQFGWMGILVDERIYMALAVLCALGVLGFVLFLLRDFAKLAVWQKMCLGLLVTSLFLTLMSYAWYNSQFVQHQGRYLFPALIPISLFFALGVWTLLDRVYAAHITLLLLAATCSIALIQWQQMGALNKWLLAWLCGAAAAFGFRLLLPSRWEVGLYALVFFGLWALNVLCLFGFIVPYFQT